MPRMVAFLVSNGSYQALTGLCASAHVSHGVEAGAVAAHVLALGLRQLNREGVEAALPELARVRNQILVEGGKASGRLPFGQARL